MKLYKALCAPASYAAKKLASYRPGIRPLTINMAQEKHQMTTQREMSTNGKSSDVTKQQPLYQKKLLQSANFKFGVGVGVAAMTLAGIGVITLVGNRVSLEQEKKFLLQQQELERMYKLRATKLEKTTKSEKTSMGESKL